MRRLPIVCMTVMACLGSMMPLRAAGAGDYDWSGAHGNYLYSRFFVDPNYTPPADEQGKRDKADTKDRTAPEKKKAALKEKTPDRDGSAKRRSLFNLNMMFGGSAAYFRMEQVVSPDYLLGYLRPATRKKEVLGAALGVNLDFVFNVAKYFALGFGADANYFSFQAISSKYSSPFTGYTVLLAKLQGYSPPDPSYYLEVPVFGMIRFYFSEKFRTAYLSLGGGMDFFLMGRPSARSYIARGGIGFMLESGFMMEFAYQYNTELDEESRLADIGDMHRGMLWMGYCFNAGGK